MAKLPVFMGTGRLEETEAGDCFLETNSFLVSLVTEVVLLSLAIRAQAWVL